MYIISGHFSFMKKKKKTKNDMKNKELSQQIGPQLFGRIRKSILT